MKIIQIDLENFKSYEDASVSFSSGTNAICGKNGAGKSSLLEAIGFAVFGYAPYKHEQLVREGEKTATVTVHVEGNDGRIYEMVRKCGSSNQYYVFDPELDEKLVSGVKDTAAWLQELFGLEPGDDLSALFEDAVGVQQGRLTGIFLEPASARKNTFNPLLGVDEYETVWSKLLEPKKYLEDLIQDDETLIAGYEGELKRLPDLVDQNQKLVKEIDQEEKAKEKVEKELEVVEKNKGSLEVTKTKIDELKDQVAKAQTEIDKEALNLKGAQKAVEDAQKAQEIVKETIAAHDDYLLNQKKVMGLEEKRGARDEFKDNLGRYKTDLAVKEERTTRKAQELAEIKKAEEQIIELEPQVKLQETLMSQRMSLFEDVSAMTQTKADLEKTQEEIEELEPKLDSIQNGLKNKEKEEKKLTTLNEEQEKLSDERGVLTEEIAKNNAALQQVKLKIKALEEESAKCPVCEEPLTAEHREELLAKYNQQTSELEAALKCFVDNKSETTDNITHYEAKINEVEKLLKTLPRQVEADELVEQINKKQPGVKEMQVAISTLVEVEVNYEQLGSQLLELDNPTETHRVLSAITVNKPEVEQDLKEATLEIEDSNKAIKAIEGELEIYRGLDEELAAARDKLQEHEDDHQRYLEHNLLAETLSEREEQVEQLENDLTKLNEEFENQRKEFEKISDEYDLEEYKELVKRYSKLQGEVATLNERLLQLNNKRADAEDELAELHQIQEDLHGVKNKMKALETNLDLLSFLRRVIREAGPEITKRLVDLISLEAERFYGDMMQNYSSRLKWTEDYDIQLITEGRVRHFPQLSGGEGMSAALAVRLALLREMSAIDVAFFDEPTANLDDQRRENLSEQIMNVKGFSQIFIISHDDTFEKDTDHIIRVVKENNTSRVEA